MTPPNNHADSSLEFSCAYRNSRNASLPSIKSEIASVVSPRLRAATNTDSFSSSLCFVSMWKRVPSSRSSYNSLRSWPVQQSPFSSVAKHFKNSSKAIASLTARGTLRILSTSFLTVGLISRQALKKPSALRAILAGSDAIRFGFIRRLTLLALLLVIGLAPNQFRFRHRKNLSHRSNESMGGFILAGCRFHAASTIPRFIQSASSVRSSASRRFALAHVGSTSRLGTTLKLSPKAS